MTKRTPNRAARPGPPRRPLGLGLPLMLVVVTALAVSALPERLKPWTPLHPDDPPSALTRWKLAGLAADPQACRTFLRQAGLDWQEVPDRREGSFCAIGDAVRLAPGSLGLAPNVPVMRCPVAAGLVSWRRHGLEPLAREVMGAELDIITHIGSYNCRRQRGNGSGLPSQHATANAIDITGFTFKGAPAARLPDGWEPGPDGDRRRARFLRGAQDGACRVFKVVLGPDSNAAHAGHFHLDMGPFWSCR